MKQRRAVTWTWGRPGLLLLVLLVASVSGCTKAPSESAQAPVRAAVAADAARAFEDLARRFEAQTGQRVEVVAGASGLLARQIEQGAPFDVFAAANVAFVDRATAVGACDDGTKTLYARGLLVVWTRATDGEHVGAVALEDLTEPRFVKISLANPDHAPYGQAAVQALERAGITDAVRNRLVYGENVRQALQFAQTGNADAAIVALSLANDAPEGQHTLVDDTLHEPLDQALVACRNGHNEAGGRAFAAYVGSTAGREILGRYGFAPPGLTADSEQREQESVRERGR